MAEPHPNASSPNPPPSTSAPLPSQSPTATTITTSARTHYDTPTTDTFYHLIWGGEDIHTGIYTSPQTTIADASRATIEKMASILIASGTSITSQTRILDLGAGYGGSARWLARKYGCRVTCLNLSSVQNERNVLLNQQAGLDALISVHEGSFEALPPEILEKGPYDVIWSQDSFLHASDREKVVEEIARVLVPGGEEEEEEEEEGRVIFTDLMASEDAFEKQPELMQAMMQRLHLDSLATVRSYVGAFGKKGFKDLGYWDGKEYFGTHYRRVGEELERAREVGGLGNVDEEVVERQAMGMKRWVKAAEEGCVDWGIFCFGR
ncbi:MAG: hypothetical protein L6R41_006479 [Letrouitia leprolyta]|nr:MAG: hypothetical protein L6R41_006479 [Letrouitia leprolyta]